VSGRPLPPSNRASAVSGRDETIARKGNPQVWALGSGLVLRDDGRAKVAQIDGSETPGLDEKQKPRSLSICLLLLDQLGMHAPPRL